MKIVVLDDDLIVVQSPRVHIADVYSEYLATTIDVTGVSAACDLTAGSGYQTLKLARYGLRVVSVDVLPEAVKLTRLNAATNGLADLVETRLGNLYEALHADERFDLVVAWPPVMPTPQEQNSDGWWSLANNGGPDGRLVFDRVIAGAAAHLLPGGSLWMPHPWFLSESETRRVADAAGLDLVLVDSRRFPMGTVSGSRLAYIKSLGFEPETEDGKPLQRLTIIRFRRRP